jgi:hypothetical protein
LWRCWLCRCGLVHKPSESVPTLRYKTYAPPTRKIKAKAVSKTAATMNKTFLRCTDFLNVLGVVSKTTSPKNRYKKTPHKSFTEHHTFRDSASGGKKHLAD